MPLDMQAKLLRAIQEGEIRRVGSNQHIKVNIRLVAATNRELGAMVKEKKFREDLFYRLNVLPVRLPPLRERREDVMLLIDAFLERYARGRPRKEVEQGAIRALMNYGWPGNVRELENEIERATIMSGEKITAADLSDNVRGGLAAVVPAFRPGSMPANAGLKDIKSNVERQMILEAIDKCSGNKSEAARLLGLSRYGLYKKMERYGM
jgi:DNA-binding NtrC family response regulator